MNSTLFKLSLKLYIQDAEFKLVKLRHEAVIRVLYRNDDQALSPLVRIVKQWISSIDFYTYFSDWDTVGENPENWSHIMTSLIGFENVSEAERIDFKFDYENEQFLPVNELRPPMTDDSNFVFAV